VNIVRSRYGCVVQIDSEKVGCAPNLEFSAGCAEAGRASLGQANEQTRCQPVSIQKDSLQPLQPKMILQLARVLQQVDLHVVDLHVAVGPERPARAGYEQAIGGADSIPEVSFRAWTGANHRRRGAKLPDLLLTDVNGVHRSEAIVQHTVFVEQRHGAHSVLGQAGFDFVGLLRDMHVYRESRDAGEFDDL